jgi:hypothetical protein
MPEHGDYNPASKQWYCSYWVSKDEWMDIHRYSPPNIPEEEKGQENEGKEEL